MNGVGPLPLTESIGCSPFQKLDYSITKVDREGSAAQVKISFIVDSRRHVTDFLNMLKLDGDWRIVNIIDH